MRSLRVESDRVRLDLASKDDNNNNNNSNNKTTNKFVSKTELC